MKQALLVIDVQNDYFPGGKMALHQPEQALAQVNQLENYFISKNLPVIYIQHIKHAENADFFGAGTIGAELHPELKTDAQSIIIEKHFPNSFLETTLAATLRELSVEQLVICGMMTHMCVDSTTRAAREMGYQPILIADATATKDLTFGGKTAAATDVQTSFLAALQNFAEVKTTAEFLA